MNQKMNQMIRKVFIFGLVFVISGLGVGLGQHLIQWTRQIQILNFSKSANALEAPPAVRSSGIVSSDRYESLELFNRVLHFVEANYVDEVKRKTLIEGAIKGMLETLDPHSNFLSSELFKEMKVDTAGKFGGLGIEIGMKDNILTILAPIEDTPAWKAGLKPNDRIVKINSESTKGMNLMEAVSKMRGKPKTNVKITVYRDGFEKLKDVSITREIIKIQAVKSEILEKGYGYVRLTTFNENAAQDVKKAIDQMQKKEKLKGLIFDLRTNPGGLLDQAVEVASLFVDEGVIVSTMGRLPIGKDGKKETSKEALKDVPKEIRNAQKGMAYKDLPVAVLVNSSSASAAEIVAGALQDHKRALILGQPTFGKGSVQTVIPLPPDMGLKLTIARYYTPNGTSIQEKGVIPDIILDDFNPKLLAQAKLKGDYFREKDLKGHMVNNDEEKTAEQKAAAAVDSAAGKEKEFKKEELDVLLKKDKKKSDSSDKNLIDEDEMAPIRFNAKEDYQVGQAVLSLKAGSLFNTIQVKKPDAPKDKE